MRPQPSSSTAGVMRLEVAPTDVAAVPKVKVFEDAAGGLWIRTYNPLSPDTANKLRSMGDSGDIELDIEPLPAEDFRAAEMAWLQANQESLAGLYPGEWLAIEGTALIAHAGDLAELLKQSRKAGHPNPFITAIPAEPIGSLHV